MMKILEDANEVVRETAKEVVIELFKYITQSILSTNNRNAPGHAKADLKKLLQTNHVRKTTANYILAQLGLIETDLSASVKSEEGFHEDPHAANTVPVTVSGNAKLDAPQQSRQRVVSATGSLTASVAGSTATTALTVNLPGAEMEAMDACLVASRGDLEYGIQGMLAAFEGRESEQNWVERDKHIMRLRGLLRGNAYKEYPTTFMNGIGSLQGGIVKGVYLFFICN
jgi:CLIP-associating protein 1/2